MPLHCAATRPKILKVPSFSFLKPCDLLIDSRFLRIEHNNFDRFFVFSRLFYVARWCQLVQIYLLILAQTNLGFGNVPI